MKRLLPVRLLRATAPAALLSLAAPVRAAEFACRLEFPSAPATALTNFPVLVRLAEDAPAGFSYTNCPAATNLWFTDRNDDPLAFETDTWNAEGDSLLWVSVPALSDAACVVLHWSDDAGDAPASPAPSAVWSRAGYVGVWHMNELLEDPATGKHYTPDSSASGWHAYRTYEKYSSPVTNAVGVTAHPTPYTGRAMDIAYGGANGWYGGFAVPASATSSTTLGGAGFTLSAIANAQMPADPGYCRVIAFGNAWNENANLTLGSDYVYCMGPGSSNSQKTTNPAGSTGWVFATDVFSTASKIYANGVNRSGDGGKPNLTSLTLNLGIGLGAFPQGFQALNGYVDEARIRNVPSTAEWVAEEYATVANADYVSFGKVCPNHPSRKATLILVK